jgi:hypothetical protein
LTKVAAASTTEYIWTQFPALYQGVSPQEKSRHADNVTFAYSSRDPSHWL